MGWPWQGDVSAWGRWWCRCCWCWSLVPVREGRWLVPVDAGPARVGLRGRSTIPYPPGGWSTGRVSSWWNELARACPPWVPVPHEQPSEPGRTERMSQGATQAVAATQGSSRDPAIDNARALLITLVVVGHLLNMISSTSGEVLYLWIYSFHMPAFVAVSGYLSRSFANKPRQ